MSYILGLEYEAPPRFLNHASTIHTKYELAPPYPFFNPKIFLKQDGVVLLNTGDSLIALSTHIDDNLGAAFHFGLYSPRVCPTISGVSSLGAASEDRGSLDSHDNRAVDRAREHLDMIGRFVATSPNSSMGNAFGMNIF